MYSPSSRTSYFTFPTFIDCSNEPVVEPRRVPLYIAGEQATGTGFEIYVLRIIVIIPHRNICATAILILFHELLYIAAHALTERTRGLRRMMIQDPSQEGGLVEQRLQHCDLVTTRATGFDSTAIFIRATWLY